MKKVFVLAFVMVLGFSAMAQNKMLSTKDLMTRELYPEYPMRSIQFVGNKMVAYIESDTLYVGAPGKAQVFMTREDLSKVMANAGESGLSYFPPVKFMNENEFRFAAKGKAFVYNKKTNSVKSIVEFKGFDNIDWENNTNNYSYSEDNGMVIVAGGKEYKITDENEDIVFGQSVHRNEFGINGGTFWSPKGNKLAFYRMDQSMVTDYPLLNTSARIAEPAPIKYPMAGMKSHEVTVGIYDVAKGKEIYLNSRKDTTVAEREMFLTNLTWSPDENFLYIAKINRGQNHMWLERYNVATGNLDKVLFEETSDRYTEPCEGLYFIPNHPDQFLWFSMRDGYKHLYLYNTDGTMIRQLTKGEYEVEGIVSFDAKGENVFVYANKENLAGKAGYKVNIKSGKMERITPVEGTHNLIVSNDGKMWVDLYSAVKVPARADVLTAKGKSYNLYNSPNPLEGYAMPNTELGTIKAADGKTDLYYRLITPPNMDKTKKYPTLVYVYGGPHSQLVTDDWMAGGNLYFTFLAQQGYVVFTVDNRGTDNRGFEFESCTHRQLGTIELADQMEGVKFLQSLPYVDQDRMGVEGWSFGGFMTITMKLAHPEIFKVGCAGGPVIDWKWYEIMYGERYMDTPQENPEGYAKASLLEKAKDLEGRLLVIHGAVDNTVVWQNSLEFIERCINNGKQVDYFIYPHHEHNVIGPERVHLFEKMFDYYETHLK